MARRRKTTEPVPAAQPRRPRIQFTIAGLLLLMVGIAAATAPAYYFVRGMHGDQNMHLIGMLAVLAGPLLLMTAVSLLLALFGWVYRR